MPLAACLKKQTMAKATKSVAKKTTTRKAAPKKAASKKGTTKKNKLGVKNSLVNNINAKKKSGASKPAKKSTVSKKAYKNMEDHWGKDS
jgi:hypothetical protein